MGDYCNMGGTLRRRGLLRSEHCFHGTLDVHLSRRQTCVKSRLLGLHFPHTSVRCAGRKPALTALIRLEGLLCTADVLRLSAVLERWGVLSRIGRYATA